LVVADRRHVLFSRPFQGGVARDLVYPHAIALPEHSESESKVATQSNRDDDRLHSQLRGFYEMAQIYVAAFQPVDVAVDSFLNSVDQVFGGRVR
jgi:hypothetical protein